MTGVLAGPFLIVGVLAWVVAIALGVGAHFDLWSWRRQWPLAGALAGAGTFALFAATHPMAASLLQLSGGFFVGCGIAVAYGTLFLHTGSYRPALRHGSVEEVLWLQDAVDRLRPQRLDWIVTGALLLPGLGLVALGLSRLSDPTPVVIGAASCLGPLYAGVGLALRHRASERMLNELAERRALEPTHASGRNG